MFEKVLPLFWAGGFVRFGVWGALLVIVLLGVAGCAFWQDARVARHWPAPGRLIDVDGVRLHLRCLGSGSALPLVLESGMGGWSQDWAAVLPALARGGMVCAYDRAGYAWSDDPVEPRSGARSVRQLKRMLDAAGVPSPRILVGHSMGGLLVDLYARTWPQDVAGVALIDAAGRDYAAQFPPARYAGFRVSLGRLLGLASMAARLGWTRLAGKGMSLVAARLPDAERESAQAWALSARHFQALTQENAAFDALLEQTLAAGPLPRVPVRVLCSGVMRDFPPGLEDEEMHAAWARNQQAVAREWGVRAQVLASSGHYLHLDAPEVVVSALDDLRAQVGESSDKSDDKSSGGAGDN